MFYGGTYGLVNVFVCDVFYPDNSTTFNIYHSVIFYTDGFHKECGCHNKKVARGTIIDFQLLFLEVGYFTVCMYVSVCVCVFVYG